MHLAFDFVIVIFLIYFFKSYSFVLYDSSLSKDKIIFECSGTVVGIVSYDYMLIRMLIITKISFNYVGHDTFICKGQILINILNICNLVHASYILCKLRCHDFVVIVCNTISSSCITCTCIYLYY